MIASSTAVFRIALSNRYALAIVTSLTPESSSFLRQRRTWGLLDLAQGDALEVSSDMAAQQIAVKQDRAVVRCSKSPLIAEACAYRPWSKWTESNRKILPDLLRALEGERMAAQRPVSGAADQDP
jgi:hypothetical protein